ncbi:MAG: DUF4292 domain-containing protein [Deltaproteobacteria bacterium]|nr:DUF4292 domain-containing protein [Deltaproteobacteria bacterium]
MTLTMNHIHEQDRAKKIPLLLLIISLFISACAAYQKPLPKPMDAEIKFILDEIRSESLYPNRMQASANVNVSASGRRYTMRMALVLKKPQSLRIESIPFIGTPDFFLTLDENKMKVFLPKEGTFYIGKPSPENFKTFFPLKLPVKGLAALLMGAIPALEKEMQLYPESKVGDILQINVLDGKNKMSTLWFDSLNHRIVKIVQFDAYENPLYTFSYGNFSEVETAVPQTILIVLEQHQAQITIRYTDIQFSIEQDDKIFDLAIPPGVWPTYLD